MSAVRRRGTAIDIAVLAVGATVVAWPSFGWPLTSVDESILLVHADQVRAGMVPHRDFFTVYGPAPSYILATLFTVLGSSVTAERALGLTLHFAIAVGIYGIGRSCGRLTALIAGGLSLILLAPLGTVAYAWLGALACVVTALALAERRSRAADVWAGVAMGLSTAFRPEMVIVILPVLAPYLWRSPRWRWLAAGLLSGIFPTGVFFLLAGPRMWWNIGPGRVGTNGSLRLLDQPGRSASILVAVLGITTVLIWFAWRRRTRVSLAHALLALAILPQTLQRVDQAHAIFTLAVTIPLVVIGAMTARPSPALLRRRMVLMVAMTVTLVGGLEAFALRSTSATTVVQFGDRSALVERSELASLTETRAALLAHAPPGGGVFVGSMDMSRDSVTFVSVYHLVPELRPRAYFLDLTGGMSSRSGSGLTQDLRRADVLLLTPLPDGLMQRLSPYAVPGSDEANAVVREEFCRVAETGWGMIYEHRRCP